MLRLLVFFIAFSIALNLQSCINDATTYVKKKINLSGIESNNTEEKSRPEDDQPLAEINPVVANGKQFVIELFKIELYYPKDWKIQINSMEEKDVDVNLQTQSDEISVRIKGKYQPDLTNVNAWEDGIYLNKIFVRSEIEKIINETDVLIIDGYSKEKLDHIRIAAFNKHGITIEFSLKALSEEAFDAFETDFMWLVESVKFLQRYDDVDV